MTIGVLVLVLFVSRQKAGEVADWYMKQAKAADGRREELSRQRSGEDLLETKKAESAEEKQEARQALAYAEMAVRTTPTAIEAKRLLAKLSQVSNPSRSLAIYQELNPEGERGDPEAHMVLANEIEKKLAALINKRDQLRQKRFGQDQKEELKKAVEEDEAMRKEKEKLEAEYVRHLAPRGIGLQPGCELQTGKCITSNLVITPKQSICSKK